MNCPGPYPTLMTTPVGGRPSLVEQPADQRARGLQPYGQRALSVSPGHHHRGELLLMVAEEQVPPAVSGRGQSR